MAIKISIGKYVIAQPFEELWRNVLDLNEMRILHIEPRHAAAVASMPFFSNNHGDPFDRLIVAQALVEGLTVVSAHQSSIPTEFSVCGKPFLMGWKTTSGGPVKMYPGPV